MIFQNNLALLCWNQSESEYIGPIGTIDKSTPLKASTKLRYVLVIDDQCKTDKDQCKAQCKADKDQCKADKDPNPNISDMPISPLLHTSKSDGRRERGGGSGVIVVQDEDGER